MFSYVSQPTEKAIRLIEDGRRATECARQLQTMSAWVLKDSRFTLSLFRKKRSNGETLRRIGKTGSFLIRDLELMMKLTRIAADPSQSSEKRKRNRVNARHAYESVSRISRDAVLHNQERREVNSGLARLRSALEQLGEVFVDRPDPLMMTDAAKTKTYDTRQ